MKIKYIIKNIVKILINTLPFPLWIAYYLLTIHSHFLFITPTDENIFIVIIAGFTVYNLFSHSVIEFLIRNLIAVASLTAACVKSGKIYLERCPHMSDEHMAVESIPYDLATTALILTAVACIISFIIVRSSFEIKIFS